MKEATKMAIRAILAADESASAEERAAIERALEGARPSEGERRIGRILKAEDVSKKLGVSTRSLRNWRDAGRLTAVYGAGRHKRAIGFTEESVLALAAGL